jgi:hypothetical protein
MTRSSLNLDSLSLVGMTPRHYLSNKYKPLSFSLCLAMCERKGGAARFV